MLPPKDTDLQFFAYGIFRPGQLAYFQLRDLVAEIADPVSTPGQLLVRDGLPLLDRTAEPYPLVEGALLTFRRGAKALAYDRVAAMEPDAQYRWDTMAVANGHANLLVARKPSKGSERWDFESHEAWDGWRDPVFTDALSVVDEILTASNPWIEGNMRQTFRLQMAYLLLWSSIERYLSLRYHLGPKHDGVSGQLSTYGLVKKIVDEPAFSAAVVARVSRTDRLYRADDPEKHVDLEPSDPNKSVAYYYQVRSNITHRGKGVSRDHETLYQALSELLPVFRDVLAAAKADAERLVVEEHP